MRRSDVWSRPPMTALEHERADQRIIDDVGRVIAERREADRRERVRPRGCFRFFHDHIEHHALWDQRMPPLGSDEWIEVVW